MYIVGVFVQYFLITRLGVNVEGKRERTTETLENNRTNVNFSLASYRRFH